MSAPTPAATRPIDQLRARLDRLASDPRARLVPDGAAIVVELRGVLDYLIQVERQIVSLTELEKRIAAIELSLQLRRSPACDSD